VREREKGKREVGKEGGEREGRVGGRK